MVRARPQKVDSDDGGKNNTARTSTYYGRSTEERIGCFQVLFAWNVVGGGKWEVRVYYHRLGLCYSRKRWIFKWNAEIRLFVARIQSGYGRFSCHSDGLLFCTSITPSMHRNDSTVIIVWSLAVGCWLSSFMITDLVPPSFCLRNHIFGPTSIIHSHSCLHSHQPAVNKIYRKMIRSAEK